MGKLRACLILDEHESLPTWAYEALKECLDNKSIEIVLVLNCDNTYTKKKLVKNFGYYLIRTLLMRPRAWQSKSLTGLADPTVNRIKFSANYEKAWQRISDKIIEQIKPQQIDVTFKFGMGLLKGADDFPSRLGILSFHHGDPQAYRGRPAGFYELYNKAPHVGAMVQKISDKLDSGQVLSFGQYSVVHHSYKRTLQSLYSGSSTLLSKAIDNLQSNQTVSIKTEGKNYRLPSNFKVVVFLCKLMNRFFRKMLYGLFFEKKWKLGTFDIEAETQLLKDYNIGKFKSIDSPKGYQFIADSFYSQENPNKVFCEAMDSKTSKGRLIDLDLETQEVREIKLSNSQGHLSYPFSISIENEEYIIPESSAFEAPKAFKVKNGGVVSEHPLKGLESERLLDPSIVYFEKKYWLFACKVTRGDQLFLWSSDNFLGPYKAHRKNPIVQDPGRARPGGRLLFIAGKMYRLGQINNINYGDGLQLSEVVQITEAEYVEKPISKIKVEGFSGPHTLDIHGKKILFDYYRDQFNPLAFLNRIKNKF